jgi:hypothetical protein
MAKVEISKSLFLEIDNKFKQKSITVLKHLKSLEDNPRKGKNIGSVGGIIIKELKFEGFRFYFITDGFKLRCMDEKELVDLLIMFVRMSDKKHQQETINKIKHILRTIGPKGFK